MGRIEDLKKNLIQGKLDGVIADHYTLEKDEKQLRQQKDRILKLLKKFENQFPDQREVILVSGPGRTELAGNHTDHQLGRVLCASVNMDILAVVSAMKEPIIEIYSQGYEPVELLLEDAEKREEEKFTSKALVKGIITWLKKNGYSTGGFRGVLDSTIPAGSGLSSSAAYEILIGQIMNHLYNEGKISPVKLAIAGQFSENEFFGKPCGLMDQMASSVGGLIAIDFMTPDRPEIEIIQADPAGEDHTLFILDTNSSHADLSEEYAAIPREMKRIASYFGKDVLRHISEDDFESCIPELRKLYGDRAVLRAMHFLEENRRVEEMKEVLKSGNLENYRFLVNQSGASSLQKLQNIWSEKNLEEQSVNIALSLVQQILNGQGAVRVHGGGFGGTIQAYVPVDKKDLFIEKLAPVFGQERLFELRIPKKGGSVLWS